MLEWTLIIFSPCVPLQPQVMPPEPPSSSPQLVGVAMSAMYDSTAEGLIHPGGGPITAQAHLWSTSPARSHLNTAQTKELPLHLIQLILTYVRLAAAFRCGLMFNDLIASC